jgi:transaldolase/glucose-6-phosphate isomerase
LFIRDTHAASRSSRFSALLPQKAANISSKKISAATFCRLKMNRQTYQLPAQLASAVNAALKDWHKNDKVRRLWASDASLWTAADEANWLGWLGIVERQLAAPQRFAEIAADVQAAGFTHALLLGMGGSSLCPEVLALTFGRIAGFPQLLVLDSTDPKQIKAFESRIDLKRTLFIVASKSGSTLEPNCFKQYFYDRVKALVGEKQAGKQFLAITDPGSKIEQTAKAEGFRRVCLGVPSIGGRFSALSDFGMVPAAVMGIDVPKFLAQANELAIACGKSVAAEQNPGVVLGAILGTAHNLGRNKLTIFASPGIHDLGAWVEQLVAESTGKAGKAIIPVNRESPRTPEAYGNDRLFVYLRLETAPAAAQDAPVAALEHAGQPVVRIAVEEIYNLGQEFFRWEFATAVAGSIIGINPFNQPDVEASKIAARKLTGEFEQAGRLPSETPLFEEGGIKLFAGAKNAAAIGTAAGSELSLTAYLKAHLGRIKPGDYFALLAYIEMNEATEKALQAVRHAVLDAKRVATCLGFGPRFLHSTGQAYKGGSNTGVFLQVTCDDSTDLSVPGRKYTFGVVKAAQARGDFEVLVERDRRALRVHLPGDVKAGLAKLQEAIKQALA